MVEKFIWNMLELALWVTFRIDGNLHKSSPNQISDCFVISIYRQTVKIVSMNCIQFHNLQIPKVKSDVFLV